MIGGDAGVTWVLASASSSSKARRTAARLLRNAKAVHRQYGAPEWIDIRVVRKGRAGAGTARARWRRAAPARTSEWSASFHRLPL
ncbi:hypothetical protein ACFQ0B_36435 [Nonomuraea thailandensis]